MKFYNDEKGVNDETYGKVNVRLVSAEKHDGFVMGRLEVRCGEQIREIRHYWYVCSPEHNRHKLPRICSSPNIEDPTKWF